MARLTQSFRFLSLPDFSSLTLQRPSSCCLSVSHRRASLTCGSSLVNPSRESESSEDSKSVNQKGYVNLVQKVGAFRSG